MSVNHKAVREGVDEAFGYWLSQHPISVPDVIAEAIGKVFGDWLDAHREAVIAAIAREAAKAAR